MVSPINSTTKQDLVQAAKAIHDEVKSGLDKQLKQMRSDLVLLATKDLSWEVDKKLKDLEERLLKSVGDLITKSLSDAEGGLLVKLGGVLEKGLEHKSKALDNSTEELSKSINLCSEAVKQLDTKLTTAENRFENSLLKAFDSLQADYKSAISEAESGCEAKFKSLEQSYHSGLEQVGSLLKSLPVPQVVLPPGAIEIKMLPSEVYVTEKAFNLHVEAPPVNVHVPEQKSIVNVQVKDLPTPVVNFTPPPPRLLVKKFKYNDFGQPEEVREEDIKET